MSARAALGCAAVAAGQRDINPDAAELDDLRAAVVDTVANVMHYADKLTLDPERILETAQLHFEEEFRQRAREQDTKHHLERIASGDPAVIDEYSNDETLALGLAYGIPGPISAEQLAREASEKLAEMEGGDQA